MQDLFGNHAEAMDNTSDDAVASAAAPEGTQDRSRELDQFYTRPEVAAKCMEYIREHVPDDIATWLEPSAGTGVFLGMLPTPRIGFDIDKEHAGEEVKLQNFLEWDGGGNLKRPVATVGNPPFGKNSSLALRFVNRAAGFSDWICMILPRTFDKAAMRNKVSLHHELVESYPLDPFSFEHQGELYDVPCCFQIWKRLPIDKKREIHRPFKTHPDFDFVDDHTKADFAFQRVGGKAGYASREGLAKSWKSNHFIKVKEGIDAQAVMDALNSIDWKDISGNTAGNPSIGKGEMIQAYSVLSSTKRKDLLNHHDE